ncbi:MAG: serine/threonine-protein kinase [Cyanobacteria bacterium J06623_7]
MTALLNNRYRIIKTLGRGGFGETYLTIDNHMPSGRKCVLKQLKPMVKQPKMPLWMKERFQREAAILEELGDGHGQIPQLYAYFSEDDKFYLVQEWIEGLTLNQYWQQEGNLHRDEVRQILTQLLPVLDYVHSRRIIHRDIKPENIILRRGDKLPFLIDFGAVKEAIATEVNGNSDSTFSASIGTPGYMSSEQAAGRPIYSSDLYSLGLTAIFLLTGLAPHELTTDPRNGEIIWREHAFNLDPELADIIDRAIRFHPRDRFTSAREMLDALNRQPVASGLSNPTGITMNVAPNRFSAAAQPQNYGRTLGYQPQAKQSAPKSWFKTVALFLLVATGVAVGTFSAGFLVVSSLWQDSEPAQPKAIEPEAPTEQPDLFPPAEETKTVKTEAELEAEAQQRLARAEAEAARRDRETAVQQTEIELNKKPKPSSKQSKTLADINLATNDEVNIPILTTGASESQLVSTFGQPNSERTGWQPNSRVLAYYDVIPDRVNLSYQADDTGKIRQADIALNSAISLGAMQQTLSRMLGENAPADIKAKLRSVYNRETNFSFFKLKNVEGKIQRDSRDRVTISVWDREFQ